MREKAMQIRPWAFIKAGDIADAVSAWAHPSYWAMRETIATVNGRIDMVLVPREFKASVARGQRGYWTDKLGLVGVEIKASRDDFLRGLREGQFDRYRSGESSELAGLFIATQVDVKTAEIPHGIGHISVRASRNGFGHVASCRRNPVWRSADLSQDTLWRIVFYAVAQANRERQQYRQAHEAAMDRVGRRVARAISAAVKVEP